jgi:hypothetical protein
VALWHVQAIALTFLAFEYVSDDHLCIDCGIWALEQVV